MKIQSVFRAGNSGVVAAPKESGLKPGGKVTVEILEGGGMVVKPLLTKTRKRSGKAAEGEFKAWLKEVLEEDGEILDELAVR